jgi:hypothetical protein
MKTLAEVYLPVEKLLISQLYVKVETTIKEIKKIPYLDSDGNPKDEFLEYFVIAPEVISFNRRNSNKKKEKVTAKELNDAIKLALRTREDLTRTGFNKMYGKSNFVGTPLYLFVNLILEDIAKRRIIGEEITHQTFGSCEISEMELKNDFVFLETEKGTKKIAMEYCFLEKADEEKIKSKVSFPQTVDIEKKY